MPDQNFKDAPISIGEIKADRSQSSMDWTVRDMLISALREIDAGAIAPDIAVLVLGKKEFSSSMTMAAGADAYQCAGLLHCALSERTSTS